MNSLEYNAVDHNYKPTHSNIGTNKPPVIQMPTVSFGSTSLRLISMTVIALYMNHCGLARLYTIICAHAKRSG